MSTQALDQQKVVLKILNKNWKSIAALQMILSARAGKRYSPRQIGNMIAPLFTEGLVEKKNVATATSKMSELQKTLHGIGSDTYKTRTYYRLSDKGLKLNL